MPRCSKEAEPRILKLIGHSELGKEKPPRHAYSWLVEQLEWGWRGSVCMSRKSHVQKHCFTHLDWSQWKFLHNENWQKADAVIFLKLFVLLFFVRLYYGWTICPFSFSRQVLTFIPILLSFKFTALLEINCCYTSHGFWVFTTMSL